MTRESDLFPELSPPGGGFARLRARRDGEERFPDEHALSWFQSVFIRLSWKEYAPLLAGACTALIIVLFVPRELSPTMAADRLIGARSEGRTLQLLDEAAAAQPLSSSQAGVRLYWTESLVVEQAPDVSQSLSPEQKL